MVIIIAIYSYLIGCFQSSYLISKLFLKEDIRLYGNGNAGASNMTVSFGWKFGAIVGFIDILKGAIAVVLTAIIFKSNQNIDTLKYISGFFVIIGHNYPFFMSFKGGKGTASLIGMILAISPFHGIIMILAFVLTSIVTNYIALGTISLVAIFAAYTFYTGNIQSFTIASAIGLLSIYKHRNNIIKIINQEETKVRNTIKKRSNND
jgi:glycerol-3-phosphate acyltransferase PlsY